MIRVQLPYHLQNLAQTSAVVELSINAPQTPRNLIKVLESRFPTLRGAIIEHGTGKRRPLIRFFACQQDISHDGMDAPLPKEVVEGKELFLIIGAISGG